CGGSRAPGLRGDAPASPPKVAKKSPAAEYTPTVRFRLRTELADGKMAFVGIGGGFEGLVNPPLRVAEGDVVQVTLINSTSRTRTPGSGRETRTLHTIATPWSAKLEPSPWTCRL
ncbi:MAG: hypothetical protein ACREJR_02060, partial [Candidatus Rokuibacteriota bacterium]